MIIEYDVTKESFIQAIKVNLKYNFKRVLLFCLCITAFFAFLQSNNGVQWQSILLHSIYFLIAVLFFIYFIAFLKSYGNFKRSLNKLDKNTIHLVITLLPDGVKIHGSEGEIMYQWPLIKRIYNIPEYISIMLLNRRIYLIPKSAFDNEQDATLFTNTIKQHLNAIKAITRPPNFSKKSYYWGLLGLIPIAGAINGLIMVISGISKYRDVKYVLIGAAGILFNAIIFAVLIYNLNGGSLTNGRFFRKGSVGLSQMQMNSIVKEIEFYKTEHDAYPDSLKQLQIKNELINIYDPLLDGMKHSIYNYHRIGNHKYTLFSSGADQIPGTADDVYPSLKIDTSKIGLVIK